MFLNCVKSMLSFKAKKKTCDISIESQILLEIMWKEDRVKRSIGWLGNCVTGK